MAKTITDLKSRNIQWIEVDEPVSGSTDPSSQGVTVQGDGSITSTVEGVDNRMPAHLWGLLKLLADIVNNGHEDDGSHNLTNEDIAAAAAILESKLDLTIFSETRPDTDEYYSQLSEVAQLLNDLWPYRRISVNNSFFNQQYYQNFKSNLGNYVTNFFETNNVTIEGTLDELTVSDNEYFIISNKKYRLYGSNSPDSTCKVSLGETIGISGTPSTVKPVWVLTLEMFQLDVESTGYFFPMANAHFNNYNASAGEHGIDFPHTDQVIAVDDTTGLDSYINDPDYNLRYDSDGNIYQDAYVIHAQMIDYVDYKFGVSDPNFRTYTSDEEVVVDLDNKGCWKSSSGVIVKPFGFVSTRNAGLYDPVYNSGGSAVLRSGSSSPISFDECFDRSRIGYYNDSGVELSDYGSATYDSTTDTYTYDGTTYYRSGRQITTVVNSSISDKVDGYVDVIYNIYDVVSCKPDVLSKDSVLKNLEQNILAGNIVSELKPTFYGTTSSMNKNSDFGLNQQQVIGFGYSESNLFGTSNNSAVFVDELNNGQTGTVDGIKKIWSDKAKTQNVSFTFTEGDSNSESKPLLLTYDASTGNVTLDTTGLTGNPIINADYTPELTWENGDTVTLSSSWTGLGTESATATIDSTDQSNHIGLTCFGMCKLDYSKGQGIPHFMEEVVKVTNRAGTELPFGLYENYSYLSKITYSGPTDSDCTDTSIVLTAEANENDDFYNGMHLTVLSTGESRKITDYDGTSRTATLESALTSAPSSGVTISIATLNYQTYNTLILDKYSRGVISGLKKELFTADSYNLVKVDRPILSFSEASDGGTPTSNGSILSNVTEGETVEVIFEPDEPFDDAFIVYFRHNQQKDIFYPVDTTDTFKIKKIGDIFSTNIGTANEPTLSYLLFIPTVDIPKTDNTSWVGSPDSDSVEMVSELREMNEIAWTQLLPFDGMTINGSDISLVDFTLKDGTTPELVSSSQIENDNAGCFVGFMLAESQNTKRDVLLISTVYKGRFDINDVSNVFQMELNKLHSVQG